MLDHNQRVLIDIQHPATNICSFLPLTFLLLPYYLSSCTLQRFSNGSDSLVILWRQQQADERPRVAITDLTARIDDEYCPRRPSGDN